VLKGSGTILAGAQPWISTDIVNRSKVNGHWVIRPGDGSEVGWIEPHVFYTATLDTGDGNLVPLKQQQYSRCGNFGGNWTKDAFLLKPGDTFSLDSAHCIPLEFQQPGRARILLHYKYDAGDGKHSRVLFPADRRSGLDVLADTPRFELVSNLVEIDVVRPLEIRAKLKRHLKVGESVRLSELMDVVLVNTSKDSIECSSPTQSTDAMFCFEKEDHDPNRGPWTRLDWGEMVSNNRNGSKKILSPGESVSLLGSATFANGTDGTLSSPSEGYHRIRAVYHTSIWDGKKTVLKSDWVEIRVDK
jgi:hypothetical protein